MRRYGLRSAKNGYRACKVTFSRGKNKDACGANHLGSKPHFSNRIRGKNQSFEGLLWDIDFNKVIMPRVIPKAEEASTVSRSPYIQMVKPERRVMATSMTHY